MQRPYEYKTELLEKWHAEAYAEGFAEGLIQALRIVIDVRGFVLDDEQERALAACRDRATLEGWIRRSVSAKTPREVFA